MGDTVALRVVPSEGVEEMARMFEGLARLARAGEIQSVLGVMTLRGNEHGYLRSIIPGDIPRLLGYMEIAKRDLVARFEPAEDR